MPVATAFVDDPASRRPNSSVRVDRLTCPQGVRREARRLYADARNGKIRPDDASRLVTCLNLILRVIESTDIEQRLRDLEQRLGQ